LNERGRSRNTWRKSVRRKKRSPPVSSAGERKACAESAFRLPPRKGGERRRNNSGEEKREKREESVRNTPMSWKERPQGPLFAKRKEKDSVFIAATILLVPFKTRKRRKGEEKEGDRLPFVTIRV